MKTISLSGFRCYDKIDIQFASGFNLIVGDNASGKTSLLRAARFALSSFFSGFSDENTLWQSLTMPTSDVWKSVIIPLQKNLSKLIFHSIRNSFKIVNICLEKSYIYGRIVLNHETYLRD